MHSKLPHPTPAEHLGTPGPERPLSAADAAQRVAGWTDLSPRRRRDLASALASVAQMAGLPPGDVALTPAALRGHVLGNTAKTYGISLSRMRNILSGLRYVLRRADVIDRADAPLTAEWAALLGRFEGRARVGMVGLARFCSSHRIAPGAVSDETLDAFEARLTTRTLTPRPRKAVGEVRGRWNRACGRVEGWPAHRLARRPRQGEYVLALPAFPESFRLDLVAFGDRLTATALDDPYADMPEDEAALLPCAKPLRASTVALRQSHCRWAASALVATGMPAAEISTLASLVTPIRRVKTILRFLLKRAGDKPSAAGTHVAEVLRIIAKYHVRSSAQDKKERKREYKRNRKKIRRWRAPVQLTYDGMTEKNELKVRAMLAPSRLELLKRLPEALMQAARILFPTSPQKANGLAMHAAAIRVLTRIPLRLANLVGLRLDQHLQRLDPKHGQITHISIPPQETKNKRAILVPVSAQTAALLEEWITDFRPVTAAPGCPYLFPGHGTGDRPITPQGMRDAVKATTKHHVGVELSPHQFRHLAASAFLREYPGLLEQVRHLLGHASVETTRRYYKRIEDEDSFRRLDEIFVSQHNVLKRRPDAKAPRPGPKSPPKGRH